VNSLLRQCRKSRSPFFFNLSFMENSSKSGLGIRITSDLHDPGEPVNSNLPSFYPTPHWPPPPVVTWNFLWPLPSPLRLSVSVSFSFWVVRVVYEVAEYSCRITTSTSHVTEGVVRFLPSGRVCLPPPTALFHKFLLLQLHHGRHACA